MFFLTVNSLSLTKILIIIVIFYDLNNVHYTVAQSILDRFRPNSNISHAGADDQVKIVSGSKVKRFERLTVPLGGTVNLLQHQPSYFGYTYVRPHLDYYLPNYRNLFITGWPYYPIRVVPHWQAGAKLTGEGIEGMISFQQLPYNNDIKVTLNATGVPVGKHALHIHTYGDLTEECKSTGGQFPNNFLGNIDVKEDGQVGVAFISIYLTLFGYNGIIGRSIVMHEKPIDLNTALNADIFSSTLHAVPDAQAYQNEENSVGEIIACVMLDLKKSLQTCGYKGPCENDHFLQWAIRTGACSQYFLDLLSWLEQQLLIVNSTAQVRDNIKSLFTMMRKSILMLPSYGSEAARSPKEFRLQTLKVLARQLELRKKPERTLNMEESPRRDNEKPKLLNNIIITLNMENKSTLCDWNQRLVRCNSKKLLEVYE